MNLPLHALLLDFDGLLADYDHRLHLQHLANAAGCTPAELDTALRGDGLELAHARGELDGDALLQALNRQLGTQLQAADWTAARHAATRLRSDSCGLLARIRPGVTIAVLTNNGRLTLPVIEQLLPGLTVLCSAALGVRKPDPAAYRAATAALACAPARTLFIDHLFRNVQGARSAGLHADTAHHTQSLRRLLKRYHLM
ncbi:HAD-IA family hydrolase [Stenotrophomonas sp. YIM B06876]|uniref:HAD-IA family hydrolase n=1 Tax=Stenotrophomonas sp. YIM B06876 TaxID=3060211 RepID=UPI00273A232B|nr:HAD-IA family hydrolase [Stenotrophomonas sp. YIM B06876]